MPTPEYFRKKRFRYNVTIAIRRSGTSVSLGNVINRKGDIIRSWKSIPISEPSPRSIESLKALAQFLFGESNHELLFTEIARKQAIPEPTQIICEDGNPERFKLVDQYIPVASDEKQNLDDEQRKENLRHNVEIAISLCKTGRALASRLHISSQTIYNWTSEGRTIAYTSPTNIRILRDLAQFLFEKRDPELLFTQTTSEIPTVKPPEIPQNTTSYTPIEELFLDIGRTLARTTLDFLHQATDIDKAIDILKQVKRFGGEKALAATISKWNR